MTRRRWLVAAGILVAAALVTITGLILMLGSLLSVAFDVVKIVSLAQ